MKKMNLANICFVTCLTTSIILMVTGFLLPPPGVIDGSVLSAAGELFGFATLAQLPRIIHGRNVTIQHGNTTISANAEQIEDVRNALEMDKQIPECYDER